MGGGREEGGGEGWRRAEDRGDGRGEGEGGKEEEDQEGEGGVPRMGAAEQEQATLDAEVGGRDERGVRVLLQVAFERLGGPFGRETLQRGGTVGVPRIDFRAAPCSFRPLRNQEEAKQHQTSRSPCVHHGRLR